MSKKCIRIPFGQKFVEPGEMSARTRGELIRCGDVPVIRWCAENSVGELLEVIHDLVVMSRCHEASGS